ncbi:MAG: N-acetylmuramoyl-L-alanine amidase [Oscillatoriales cyanobacterium C42_A2020_001]|nr:N-acetylmuramoyl-L-alanine amidase [Leptolyngbyaceae cyanobacterium C42_A2020_001]
MKLGNFSQRCQQLLHPLFYSLLFTPSVLLVAPAAHATKIESWRFNIYQSQLEFSTDEGVQPQAQLVTNPTRLVIDLPGVTLGRSTIQETYNGPIRSMRIAQFDRGTTRLVIEVAPGYTLDPNRIKFRGITPQQWIVTLPKPIPIPGMSTSVVSPAVNPAVAPIVLQPKAIAPPLVQPRAIATPPAVPPIPNGRVVVVIDPGHGGPDPGAVGIGGLQEKGIVLDIGAKVAAILQQRGVYAMLTRADDRDLDLEPRVQMAEQVNATVFVSIHANSISLDRPEVSGLETYYFQSGSELAQTIHQAILQTTGVMDRGVRTARFYVLRKTSMPSVLVEVGFVTGQDDAARLSNPSYRTQMADAIARGILQYLQRTAKR